MNNKKVIVTGGAGFIGSNLVDALVERGYHVHVVDNLAAGNRKQVNREATFHKADIRDLKGLIKIFKGSTYVFHCAALPRVSFSIEHPLETHDVNVTGTLNVLEAARAAGVKKVVYSASSSAYGDQPVMPLREDMKAAPKSPYAVHKYVGEVYCRTWFQVYGLPTVSLRYFNVYGPRHSHEGAYALLIAKFLHLKNIGEKMTITGDGKQTRDFTHVSDVVRANILAAESKRVGSGEVINIGAGSNVSVNEIARMIGGEVAYIPARLEPHDTLADNSLARTILGWKPKMTVEKGIAELKNAKTKKK